MSQAGPLDAESSNPQIPTSFITDDGTAVPILNELELLGEVVPNAGIPFRSTGAGNVVTYQIQYADETAVTDATKVGVASFDSAAFAVDANGFVTLIGGGVAATNIDVDTSTPPGTDPVVPDGAGNIVMTGGQVASGTVGANVIRTNSTAANSLTIEIQRTTAAAGTNVNQNGVAHFNSTDFSVDANGFVSLSGSGNAIDSIGVDATSGGGTNPVLPTAAGLVTVNGALVAAGTNPIRSVSTAANVYQIQAQTSQALAATDATKVGMANFDSADFAVDANGFVSLSSAIVDLHTAQFIVSAGGIADGANYTTIASAITAASSGDTIFIQPGTYTENLTLKAGVNLTAYVCDSSLNNTGNVIILGKCTFTSAGTVTISGIELQTNSDFFLEVTGANVSIVNLVGCYLNCSDNNGISYTCTGVGTNLNISYCSGDIGTTGITLYVNTTTGFMNFKYCSITNSGASVTPSSSGSSGDVTFLYTDIRHPITAITNSGVIADYSRFDCENIIVTAFLSTSAFAHQFSNCYIGGNSQPAITVDNTISLIDCTINSSNTSAISGTGTALYAGLTFPGTSSNISTSLQTVGKEGPSRTIGSSNSGGTNTHTITNTSNTASSQALQNIVVAGTSAGDAFQTFTITGTTNWSQGVDNSVTGDPFVIAASTALGTTNIMSATTAGEINYPLQPAFMAYQASNSANATGNGTTYTLGTTTDLTEVFDQNSDFDPASGTFTAPVTGRYSFDGIADMNALTAAMTTGQMQIQTSNRLWITNYVNIGAGRTVSALADHYGLQASIFTDMDAADTAVCKVQVNGGAGDTAGVSGSANATTAFAGKLEC